MIGLDRVYLLVVATQQPVELNDHRLHERCAPPTVRMFSEKPYQSQIIEEELKMRKSLQRKKDYSKSKKQIPVNSFLVKSKSYLHLFLETSSIHGLNHFVASRRHSCEIFLWLSVVCLSVFGAMYLSQTTWIRYQSSPTVVSMERDMFAWNTTFPCITICPEKKIDEAKLENYLENSDDPDKSKLKEFITALTYATYETLDSVPKYEGILANDYMDVILNVAPDFKPDINIGALGVSLRLVPTVTEMGLCYSVNSKVAVYNSPSYRANDKWDLIKEENDTFFVHPLDGEVFAQLLNISSSYIVYVHGPLEVPDIATKHQHSSKNFYMKIYVTAVTVYTSSEAARLSVGQRRCRFPHENILKHNAVYSYTLCRMECRIKLCLKYCNCVPHFYRSIRGEKICDVNGLHCLVKHRDVLYKLRDGSGKKVKCECFPLCDDINYVIQSNALQEWYLGTNLQWGIVTYPRMRYRRDIIFGFTDVLVAVGGMAGLFLGCSVLSFMEIVYFLTLRLFWYFRGRRFNLGSGAIGRDAHRLILTHRRDKKRQLVVEFWMVTSELPQLEQPAN
ncbi:sodium channel protein Nach-like [Battus philenor]|uniref:sodium channel protein Nach-like n=1 Tax=Battus philenor TaxID=42288 RepID=UPI0035CFCD60